MDKKDIKIGLALSGGGIRATIFHLGVFKWLAEMGLMENVEHISSVSGASICVGLIYAMNNYKWPSSNEFIQKVLPDIKKTILSVDIQKKAISNLVKCPSHIISGKNNILAKTLRQEFNIKGRFGCLKETPRWSINGTTFETGKSFRFSQKHMGDYKVGYAKTDNFPITNAIAVSAGFPILIGLYKLKLEQYEWKKKNAGIEQKIQHNEKYIHIWDGGVYDNLGLEAIYKMDKGGRLRDELNFIIVSNASAELRYDKRVKTNLKRLLDISMDQVSALRSRSVMDYIIRNKNGMFIKIGNSATAITGAKDSIIDEELKNSLINECMPENAAKRVKEYPTNLKKPSLEMYNLILRQGYENAKCVYNSYDTILKNTFK